MGAAARNLLAGRNFSLDDGMAVQSPWQQNEQLWTIQLGPFNQGAQSVSQLDFVCIMVTIIGIITTVRTGKFRLQIILQFTK